jgi:hypothetical protein
MSVAVVENVIIAVAYALIAFLSVPILTVPVPGLLLWMLRSAGILFFLGCGAHHADMALHAATRTPVDLASAHMLIFDGAQAVAAPAFAVLSLIALQYVTIRVLKRPEKVVAEVERDS